MFILRLFCMRVFSIWFLMNKSCLEFSKKFLYFYYYNFKFTRGPKGSKTKNRYFYFEFEIDNRVWNKILIGVSNRAVIFLIKLFIPEFTCPPLRARYLYGQGSGVNGTKSCIVGLSWHLNVLRVMVFDATFNNNSVICGSQF